LPPVNPCGAIVGRSRTCGQWEVNFFRDDPTKITTIKTYFVPETNAWLPWPTIFCPDFWIRNETYPLPGVVLDEYIYYNGADVWHCDGANLVGNRQQWEEGCLTTDPVPEYDPVTLCPVACECGPVIPPNPIHFDCGYCPAGAYTRYRFTIAGATGTAAPYNGTWVLEWQGGCDWLVTIQGDDFVFFFYSGVDATWRVVLPGIVAWDALAAGLGCLIPKSLTKALGSSSWPASIAMEPDL